MNLSAVSHRSLFTDCYPLDKEKIRINLHTGKDITAVNLIFEDPYAHGIGSNVQWQGRTMAMDISRELKHGYIFSAVVAPEYRRLQYCFELFSEDETVLMLEDDFYTREAARKPGRLLQYFKFPYINPCDVITPPGWVGDTVWYQIMPDRFCNAGGRKRMLQKNWEHRNHITGFDFFGGDLRGIIEKLPYIRDLGITGIYLLPVFLSDSNHTYNTFDYTKIDPDFGTEADMVRLVNTAHEMGIRVMLDAVFNHSGTEFAPWQDVWEKGEASPYFDWFVIHQKPFKRKRGSLRDGRFDGFAFLDFMPKLNTGNPEVQAYFGQICTHWVRDWGIDGIRFDVGNEISHQFLRYMNRHLKAINPELFLLGEIWMDSAEWLRGDEYDSVMNYPFFESLQNFWVDETADSRAFMYAMNRVYSLYPEQVNQVLFNHLDTHDTMRALTRCGSLDVFRQQQAVLMTLPGSPCIYYGTELAMEGGHDPDCRRTMPWRDMEAGKFAGHQAFTKALIALRKDYPQLRGSEILWHHDEANPRLVCYDRPGETETIRVYLNCTEKDLLLPANAIFTYRYENAILKKNGILITSIKKG